MKKYLLFTTLFFCIIPAFGQDYNYQFRLRLKDKGEATYSVDRPEEFLSQKAIDRRKRQDIPVRRTDFPVSRKYIETIKQQKNKVIAKSKWFNTVTVNCADSTLIDSLTALPFVSEAQFVWRGIQRAQQAVADSIDFYPIAAQKDSLYYGKGWDNIRLNNGQALHNAGYTGEGMDIAVIDAGFNQLPKIEFLDNISIKGAKSFIYGFENQFDNGANAHGLMVLSCMAANRPYQMVGTAPGANYWLFSSEDTRSEFPVEEDYWMAAAEYADSVGVDVINTSLGYSRFDFPASDYTHRDIDGRVSFIARGVNAAASKGILLICSAGNSGDSEWHRITTPSDAEYCLTVGAIRRDSALATFSSRGPSADLRVKPDAMALGVRAAVIKDNGTIGYSYGTSFSSPIMCGLAACLWQAYPSLTNKEIMRVIRQSGNKYEDPDYNYGYGIPDMAKAMELAGDVERAKIAKFKEQIKL